MSGAGPEQFLPANNTFTTDLTGWTPVLFLDPGAPGVAVPTVTWVNTNYGVAPGAMKVVNNDWLGVVLSSTVIPVRPGDAITMTGSAVVVGTSPAPYFGMRCYSDAAGTVLVSTIEEYAPFTIPSGVLSIRPSCISVLGNTPDYVVFDDVKVVRTRP